MSSKKAINITAPQLALRDVDDQDIQELLEEWKQETEADMSAFPPDEVILLGPAGDQNKEDKPAV